MFTMSSPTSFKDGDRSQPAFGKQETHVDEISPSNDSEYENQIRVASPKLRGRALTAALAFVAGTGFTLFGYVSTECTSRLSGSFIGDNLGMIKV